MPKFKNLTGRLVVFSDNIDGTQHWYNIQPGETVEVSGNYVEQAAIKRGLTLTDGKPIPIAIATKPESALSPKSKIKKPKKKK